MKIIKNIYRILIILVILFSITLSLLSCKVNSVDNDYIVQNKVSSDYSIDKAIEVNSFENLTKETGYYKFYLSIMKIHKIQKNRLIINFFN